MKKRIISLILAISVLFPLIPVVRSEEEAVTDPYAVVEEQLRAYAASHDQKDAVSSASAALAIHGITMGGRTLTFGENSAMTAVVLNSNWFQVAVRDSVVAASEYMRLFGLDTSLVFSVGIDWGEKATYSTITYLSADKTYDNRDTKLADGSFLAVGRNDYDDALEWMAGGVCADLSFTQKQITEEAVTYAISCTITDSFDFHTSLNEGFKQWMSGIGEIMFREFDWKIRLSFELTVPYSCDHAFESYHWTYDAEHFLMNNDASGGFAENQAEQHIYIDSAEKVRYYYELQKPVRLLHDKPWVMEYEVRKPGSFALAPFVRTYDSRHPYLYNRARMYLLAAQYEFVVLSDAELKELGLDDNTQRRTHFYGTAMSDLFTYSYKTNYTIRLENNILPDGGNMVSVTVYDENRDVVLDVPMDDYYLTESWGEKMVPQSTASNGISGLDFIINFIGNKGAPFSADYFDLRIWENGESSMTESAFSAKTVEPTCTEDGGVVHTCALCGYSYKTDTVPAYGHSFGDWYVEKAAACAESGQERRDCADCGAFETRETPAPGHDYTAAVTAPTCTAEGYTTYVCACGESYVDDYTEALGHDFTEWQITDAPDCTEAGMEERRCLRCDHRESRVVDALGHRYEAIVTEPTCTLGGYTDYICECGDSYRSDYTGPAGHQYEAEVTEATCTVGGYTTYTCFCGDSYKSNFTGPAGHDMGEWETIAEATCTGDGIERKSCSRCDHAESRTVKALGHDSDGVFCTRCGVVLANPFADVPAGAWFESPVLWALQNGITNGLSATEFGPNAICNRAQVVTFLWRAAGCPDPTSTENPFVDVAAGSFYEKPVLWAVENGITNGADTTHFNPNGDCNRAQVVTFLYRAFESPAVSTEGLPFTDVPAGAWYEAPIAWAVENGITNGLSATEFGPNSSCNRAQVVTFLYRAYN